MSKLVIVESPAKAKTINKYLGKDYTVIASMGHIRDLPKSKLGVDIENDFEPKYMNMADKKEIIGKLKTAAESASEVFLATDPDREGEAISWHLAHILGLSPDLRNRVTFNEITKTGVTNGMNAPRAIDLDLVDAQQARRVLDRIVGYKISPFLWRKIKKGLSAGRVQSVAVKLIVDREREISAFNAEEYWTIEASLSKSGDRKRFKAKLYSFDGKKCELKNKEDTDKILASLEGAEYKTASVKEAKRKKHSAPPFTTSTLQQEASRKLGFQAKRTMKAAQELYDGVEISSVGAVGLITYMRTDSLRISADALASAREFISAQFGGKYVPDKPNFYKSKRDSQDAHEAIRPTNVSLTPEMVEKDLTPDQFKLYKLIWSRFMACQMADAVLNTVSVDVEAGSALFKASGYSVLFDGYTKLYEEGKDEKDEEGKALPELSEGEALKLHGLSGDQHFTEPPARYTEASLIKALEENGIGRPSTYAPTISTILSRNYVERAAKALKPTTLGEVTTSLMEDQFKSIVDIKFTAEMEDELDRIEEGKLNWKESIRAFFGPFEKSLEEAEKNMQGTRVKIPDEETEEICEKCGRKMVIKEGRFGKFLACPGYPECKNTKRLTVETPGSCPVCSGKVVQLKSKKGKTFYSCSNNPKCKFMTWDEPTKDVCPSCGSTLFKRKGKDAGIYCLKEGCGFKKEAKKRQTKKEKE